MDIKHVKTFCAVVKHGGFSKAAEALSYAQSTVTMHIQSLEHDLDLRLFDRLGKKTILTEPGKRFHQYAIELLAIYEKAKEISKEKHEVTGSLNITANESVAVYLLPRILKKFKEQHPKVNIVIEASSGINELQRLREGETDVVFRIGEKQTFEELTTIPLRLEKFGWIMPAGYKDGDGLLQQYPFIYTEPECSYRKLVHQVLLENGTTPERTLESSSIEVIKQSVIANLGVAILPHMVTREAEAKGDLVYREIQMPTEIYSQAYYHKNRWLSPVMKAFIDLLSKEFDATEMSGELS
ncbi:LysR family transcriptional regulator [Neobacillus mesonae]|nr:LysR family transcriptional regulator [Neobacillus mesonae]